jgi:succinate dehydrogenase/fumarate reductase-like Fe-S protein
MAVNPIHDIIAIRDLFKDVQAFDPKKHSIANYLEKMKMKLAELNKIFVKYFG